VWGSLISVFLGGLSLGAYLGGRLADRRPAPWKLGVVLAVAGAITATLPLYSEGVLDWMFPGAGAPLPIELRAPDAAPGELAVYLPPDLRLPTLGAGLVLFGAPSLLLGMVSPYAARLFVRAMGRLGTGVGKVYGVSTLGSIAGTLGTSFFLVGWMGTRWLLVGNGLLLVGVGAALAGVSALWRPAAVDEVQAD